MKKYLIIAFLVFGLLLFGCPGGEETTPAKETTPPEETPEEPPVIVGNDSDEHGCIGSAGYVWCEPLQECIRPWETNCTEEETPMPGSDRDEHGCIPSAGYSWCEPLQECIRPWETECPETPPMVGNDSDEHGCIGSAGYSWCEELQECVRPWETPCTSLIDDVAKGFCNGENVDTVYVCGDHFRTVSTLMGGGSTIYDASGAEIVTCPVVAPDSMSDLCKQYLLGDNCVEKEVC